MSKIIGAILCFLSVIIFYCAFFLLAPFIASTIPNGEWHNLFVIITYAIVAYFGGIGIPLFLLIVGICLIFRMV